eukprot:g1373.t1
MGDRDAREMKPPPGNEISVDDPVLPATTSNFEVPNPVSIGDHVELRESFPRRTNSKCPRIEASPVDDIGLYDDESIQHVDAKVDNFNDFTAPTATAVTSTTPTSATITRYPDSVQVPTQAAVENESRNASIVPVLSSHTRPLNLPPPSISLHPLQYPSSSMLPNLVNEDESDIEVNDLSEDEETEKMCPPVIFSRKFHKSKIVRMTQSHHYNDDVSMSNEMFSNPHEEHGYKFELKFYPLGNGPGNRDRISAYVKVSSGTTRLRFGWKMHLKFTFTIVNHKNPALSVTRFEDHIFCDREDDRGFGDLNGDDRMKPYGDFTGYAQKLWETGMMNGVDGFLDASKALEVRVRLDMKEMYHAPDGRHRSKSWCQDYNCKRETGMVGLLNQGATCYLNSLLQALYHVGRLRNAVYSLSTSFADIDVAKTSDNKNVALAIQRVFHDLQIGDRAVSTKKLTEAFGWTSVDAFEQHDVQEMSRVLCDKLEEKMKGSSADGIIQKLFVGKMRNFIKCVSVDYESTRDENFYDVQLDVKGCNDVIASFEKYTQMEDLNGENQYDAGAKYGKQDAKKGTKFITLPPVLHLHLKRFEYDMMTGVMVKVNDRYEFPEVLDLTSFEEEGKDDDVSSGEKKEGENIDKKNETPKHTTKPKEITENKTSIQKKKKKKAIYKLQCVLVHSGSVHGGHYIVYVRPHLGSPDTQKEKQWFKFNDDFVKMVSKKEAIQDNYGCSRKRFRNGVQKISSFSSAYMLAYVRESEMDYVMPQEFAIDNCDAIPRILRDRFQKEQEDAKRRIEEAEEERRHLYVRVVTEEDMKAFDESLLYRMQDSNQLPHDWVFLPRCKLHRTKRLNTVRDFRLELAKKLSIPEIDLEIRKVEFFDHEIFRPTSLLTGDEKYLSRSLEELEMAQEKDSKTIKTKYNINYELTLLAVPRKPFQYVFREIRRPISMDLQTSSEQFFLFKEYDPNAPKGKQLMYSFYASMTDEATMNDVKEIIRKNCSIATEVNVRLWDFFCFDSLRRKNNSNSYKAPIPLNVSPLSTLKQEQMINGDIIIFQRLNPFVMDLVSASDKNCESKNQIGTQEDVTKAIRSILRLAMRRVTLRVISLPKERSGIGRDVLMLDKDDVDDDVIELEKPLYIEAYLSDTLPMLMDRIGSALSPPVDPLYLRLRFAQNRAHRRRNRKDQPMKFPFSYGENMESWRQEPSLRSAYMNELENRSFDTPLKRMKRKEMSIPIYYEKLTKPITDLEKMEEIKINLSPYDFPSKENNDDKDATIVKLMLRKDTLIKDVIEKVMEKLGILRKGNEKVCLTLLQHDLTKPRKRDAKFLSNQLKIGDVSRYAKIHSSRLYAVRISDISMDRKGKHVMIVHCIERLNQTHPKSFARPFIVDINDGEIVDVIAQRIAKRLENACPVWLKQKRIEPNAIHTGNYKLMIPQKKRFENNGYHNDHFSTYAYTNNHNFSNYGNLSNLNKADEAARILNGTDIVSNLLFDSDEIKMDIANETKHSYDQRDNLFKDDFNATEDVVPVLFLCHTEKKGVPNSPQTYLGRKRNGKLKRGVGIKIHN